MHFVIPFLPEVLQILQINSYTLTTAHHPQFKPVVVHEFGHSFGALADEYFYDEPDHTAGTYKLDYEPWEQNITSLVDFDSKWADMVICLPMHHALTEEDVKRALCKYIEDGGYNMELCNYINERIWL